MQKETTTTKAARHAGQYQTNSMVDNYINGNLTTAKAQAKRISMLAIVNILRDDYGKSADAALAIAAFLKGQGSFQAACDAEARQ